MNHAVFIPARLHSTRLPGKLLADINGKTVLERAWDCGRSITNNVWIATGDKEIIEFCRQKEMKWIETSANHPNGTSRCAEAAARVFEADEKAIIVNLQADEIDLAPSQMIRLIASAVHPRQVSTLVYPISGDQSSGTVKAAVDSSGHCRWFARDGMASAQYGHVGIYCFSSPKDLFNIPKEPSQMGKIESLEQLAWIESGWMIKAVEIERQPISINTEQDLIRARRSMS